LRSRQCELSSVHGGGDSAQLVVNMDTVHLEAVRLMRGVMASDTCCFGYPIIVGIYRVKYNKTVEK
jgi:hypothetical protein